MCEGIEFLSSKGEDNEEIEYGSELNLGDAPMASPLNFKKHQASKLGHPLFFIDYHEVIFVELSFYHFTYYVLCLERIFTFSFVCYFAGHMLVGSLLYL